MSNTKKKGYRTERKIKLLLEKYGWRVVRSGASLGESDLICIKSGKCLLLQVKSSKKGTFYYYGYKKNKIEGFPFYIIIDFGYGKIRILSPKEKININDGIDIIKFLQKVK